MKKTHIVTLATLGLLAFMSPTALAVDGDIGAIITLSQTPLTITPFANMEFGELTIPSDAPAVWTIPASAIDYAFIKTGGNSVDVTAGDHNPGALLIEGVPSLSVAYSALVTTNFSGPGLSLSNFMFSEYDPGGLPPGVFLLVVGADLTIGTDAIPGIDGAVITITVNYQ